MKKEEIIKEIENRVTSAKEKKYTIWTIGITDNLKRRKKEHDNPKHWKDWKADTEEIARNVEKHFLDKGMKGDTGGGDTPNYVYIF